MYNFRIGDLLKDKNRMSLHSKTWSGFVAKIRLTK